MVKDAILDYEAILFELQHCKKGTNYLKYTRMFEATVSCLVYSDYLSDERQNWFFLNPAPSYSQFDLSTPRTILGLNTISLSPCALCLSRFPLNDIIVCTCGHLYHPWCLGIWFRVSSQCVDNSCDATGHPSWFNNFGFGKLHLALDQLDKSLKLEEEQDKLLEALTSKILKEHPNIDMIPCGSPLFSCPNLFII